MPPSTTGKFFPSGGPFGDFSPSGGPFGDRSLPAPSPLALAVDALVAGHDVDVLGVLPSLRAQALLVYAGAAADSVDVAAIVDVLRRRPRFLDQDVAIGADDPVVNALVDARGVGAADRAARALVDAAVLALEGQKLRHGFVAPSSSLKAHFASPDEAKAILNLVAEQADQLQVTPPALSSWRPPPLPTDRVVHVVVGGGARRVLDLLSPSVRRLKVELSLVGRGPRGAHAVGDDDDVYRGLALLHNDDVKSVVERRGADADEGCVEADDGAGFVVDVARLHEELVDRRARSLIMPLKKARAVVIGVVDVTAVGAVCEALLEAGVSVGSVQSLISATPLGGDDDDNDDSHDNDDPSIVDAGDLRLWPGRAAAFSVSAPSSLVWTSQHRADAGAMMAAQALAKARLMASLSSSSSSWPVERRRFVRDDGSGPALRALASMVSLEGRPTPRA